MPGLWEKNARPGWCNPQVSKHLFPDEVPNGKNIDNFGFFYQGYQFWKPVLTSCPLPFEPLINPAG
jgi:hypothetical protein